MIYDNQFCKIEGEYSPSIIFYIFIKNYILFLYEGDNDIS